MSNQNKVIVGILILLITAALIGGFLVSVTLSQNQNGPIIIIPSLSPVPRFVIEPLTYSESVGGSIFYIVTLTPTRFFPPTQKPSTTPVTPTVTPTFVPPTVVTQNPLTPSPTFDYSIVLSSEPPKLP